MNREKLLEIAREIIEKSERERKLFAEWETEIRVRWGENEENDAPVV